MEQLQTETMDKTGCRLLAIAIIKSAIHDAKIHNEYGFFGSELFHFYAGIAYGGKKDYRSDEDIIKDIKNGKLETDLRKGNGGQHSKWS